MSARPNILLILTDMQRADTIAALGNPVIKTPNLDRLVREGTAFTHCYSPSPVCCPARCSLHYGMWPQRTGCNRNMPMPRFEGDSYPERLAAAGYRTHSIGKCHWNQIDDRHGFDSKEVQEEITSDPEQDDYIRYLRTNGLDHIQDPHGVRGEMYYIPQTAQMAPAHHPTQWVGDRACAFLADAGDAPWMLKVSFIHPHPPFAVPTPWHKLYRGPAMPHALVPADREAHLTYGNRFQNRYKYRDNGIDRNLLRQITAYYYACISFIDLQVGRILDQLEASGQLDDTLIVFTSDHGEYLGDYHCFGKRSMHDASSRVPLIARHPATMPAGLRIDQAASLVDIAPTFCARGEARGDGMDGVDLAALAAGDVDRPYVFAQHHEAGLGEYMIANQDWKLFYSAADDRTYCYDKTASPREQQLAGDNPVYRAKRAELTAELQRFLLAVGQPDAVEDLGDGTLDWTRYPKQTMPEDPDAGLLFQDHPWADTAIPGYTDA